MAYSLSVECTFSNQRFVNYIVSAKRKNIFKIGLIVSGICLKKHLDKGSSIQVDDFVEKITNISSVSQMVGEIF